MSRTYNQWNNHKFKFPFPDSDSISETFSQAYQDIFVLTLLGGKKFGTYLEIGCNVPDYTNNTYLLAKNFDWNGISLDWGDHFASEWKNLRPQNTFVSADALFFDYRSALRAQFGDQTIIDYLQVDIEPPLNTLAALKKIPHDEYRFRVITFETDSYSGNEGQLVRQESRQFLSNLGYELIVGDAMVDNNNPYEDWWVDTSLVDNSIANSIKLQAQVEQRPAQLLFY